MIIDVRSRESVYLSIYGYTVYVDFSGDKKPFIDIWRDDDDNYTMSVGSDILRGQKPAS